MVVVSRRALSNSFVESPRSGLLISPAIIWKLLASAAVSAAICAASSCAMAVNCGSVSKMNRAPSAASRLTRRVARKPGNPVTKTISLNAIIRECQISFSLSCRELQGKRLSDIKSDSSIIQSKLMADWLKEELTLQEDHTWRARPGCKIFVADRGALRLDYPDRKSVV